VHSSELLSEEWCNLVFEGRNKHYGAYALRRDAGRRYARALCLMLGALGLLLLVPLAFGLYVRHTLQQAVDDLEVVARLKPLEPEPGHEVKAVSAGRRALPAMRPGASQAAPEIVDGLVAPKPVGIDGPVTFRTDDDLFVMADADSLHNADRTDLPVEGVQLTPTEVVEQMPEFPGGVAGLMKWLDKHLIYPKSCVDAKIEGDVEVTFLVDAAGKVTDPAVAKSLHPELDRAALFALSRMPRWKPGRSGGKVTIVRVTIPIHFQLN